MSCISLTFFPGQASLEDFAVRAKRLPVFELILHFFGSKHPETHPLLSFCDFADVWAVFLFLQLVLKQKVAHAVGVDWSVKLRYVLLAAVPHVAACNAKPPNKSWTNWANSNHIAFCVSKWRCLVCAVSLPTISSLYPAILWSGELHQADPSSNFVSTFEVHFEDVWLDTTLRAQATRTRLTWMQQFAHLDLKQKMFKAGDCYSYISFAVLCILPACFSVCQ